MIIVDFLTLRMPGMLNQLSVSILYKKIGEKEISIPFGDVVELQNQGLKPAVGFSVLQPEIILPGFLNLHSFGQNL